MEEISSTMSEETQNNVPEWAKGEGWEWVHILGFNEPMAIHGTREMSIETDGCMMIGTRIYRFPAPEDARLVADMLIAGKVLPTPREKALESFLRKKLNSGDSSMACVAYEALEAMGLNP